MTPSLSIRSHTLRLVGWRWLGFLPFMVLLFGAAAFWSRPSVTVSPGRASLAVIHVGWLNHLNRISVTANGRSIPVAVEGIRIVPRVRLAPGTVVVVATSVNAPTWNPLGSVAESHLSLVVPPNPVLTAKVVTVPLGRPVVVPLSGPAAVAYVRLNTGTGWTTLTGGPRLQVGPPQWRPGQTGVIEVRTRARPWERSSGPQLLAWRSVPWLTARIEASARPLTPITVVFSAPVARGTRRFLQWSPSLSGRWRRLGPTRFTFSPSGAVWPDALYTLTITGGSHGVRATTGSYLPAVLRLAWTAPNGSLLRVQQLLAQLQYLPLQWQPASAVPPSTLSTQIAAAYTPPTGTFSWRYPNVPPTLAALWQPGVDTVMTTGAVMAFERRSGLPVDGQVGPAVWKALIEAALAGRVNPDGYSYVYVSETLPERLTIWHNGQMVLTSLANTGIPQSPTYLGTSPVYLRYVSQTMSGVNPDGTPYVDPGVPWVNYFAGGDAVHGFVRAQYGFPQSLGCVELPIPEAAIAWTYIHYGTLVTVEPPGSPSLP